MSVRSVIQVAIQIDTFRNIDIPKQGLFQIRTRVYHAPKDDTKVL